MVIIEVCLSILLVFFLNNIVVICSLYKWIVFSFRVPIPFCNTNKTTKKTGMACPYCNTQQTGTSDISYCNTGKLERVTCPWCDTKKTGKSTNSFL